MLASEISSIVWRFFISFLWMWIILAAEILVIRHAIEDNPELYLDELRAWLEYQTGEVFAMQTLSKTVRQMGLTVKKVLKARDSSQIFVANYVKRLLQYR